MSSFEFGSPTSETADLVKVDEMSFGVVYGFWRKFLRWSRLAPDSVAPDFWCRASSVDSLVKGPLLMLTPEIRVSKCPLR